MSIEEARLRFVAKAAKYSATIQDLQRIQLIETFTEQPRPEWIAEAKRAIKFAENELTQALIATHIEIERQERRCKTVA